MKTGFRMVLVPVMAAGLAVLTGCRDQDPAGEPRLSPVDLPEIDLPKGDLRPGASRERIEAGGGLSTVHYQVSPTFLRSAPGSGSGLSAAASDPFAAPSAISSSGIRRKTSRDVLEAFGVTFPQGAGAVYDPVSRTLTVTAPPEQLDLVEAVVESLRTSSEKQINVLVEIYELPAEHVLKLQRSAGVRADHGPEREAASQFVEKGGGRFVTSATIIARSGQRSKAEAADERIYVSKYAWADPEKKERLVPEFETARVGTVLTVDPVLGPDDVTIDLNFDLEHHTAPPTEETDRVMLPGLDRPIEFTAPVFHRKTITTQLTLFSGYTKLLGVWPVTGRGEAAERELMQIAFLKADVQLAF